MVEMGHYPKAPLDGYKFFLLQQKNSVGSGNKFEQFGEMWKLVPEETKKHYTEEAQKLNANLPYLRDPAFIQLTKEKRLAKKLKKENASKEIELEKQRNDLIKTIMEAHQQSN